MINFFKNNFLFILICTLWWVIGKSNENAGVIIVIVSYLLFMASNRYQEQLLGLIFLIALSDNYFMYFAQQAKTFVLVLMFLYSLTNKDLLFKAGFHKAFIPFFVLATFTLFFSPNFNLSFQKYLSYLLLFLTVPSYCFYIYENHGNSFIKNWSMLSLTLIAICLALKYVNPGYAIFDGGRLRGIFGNPNGFAIFCVFTILFFEVSRNYLNCKYTRIELIAFYAIVFLAIWWSGSRSALVATGIFFTFSKINKLSPFLGFLLLIIVTFTYEYIISFGVEILTLMGYAEKLRLTGEQGVETGSGRLVAWKFAWEEIQKNIVMGMGWAYDEILFFDPKVQMSLNMLNHKGGVHNSYLIFMLNQGLVGLVLFLIAIIGSFLKAAKKSIYALPVMYSCFFMANFEPWMQSSLNPYTIQMIMMLTLFIYVDVSEENDSVELDNELEINETQNKLVKA